MNVNVVLRGARPAARFTPLKYKISRRQGAIPSESDMRGALFCARGYWNHYTLWEYVL